MTPPVAPQSKPIKNALICSALLGGLLLFLFIRSFHPDEVVFSNDGPYGLMVAQQNRMPAIMTGLWQNLNWLGDRAPSPSLCISSALRLVTSPLGYSKIFCPTSIFIFGICAWFCFWQWKLSPLACVLGALAGAFSPHFFSNACWGVASQNIGMGMCFIAIGLVGKRSGWKFWVRLVLAGLAVGINIMESYDIGAIFSLFVAAFVLYDGLISESSPGIGFIKGVGQVAIVAGFAAFCAVQAIIVLYGTQVKGITDERTNMTADQKWQWATQWSMPPREFPRIFISGLFGYRMDTPKDMAAFGDWFQGGAYWGGVGSAPQIDDMIEQYHRSGNEGIPPQLSSNSRIPWRFNGGSEYAGVLVVVVCLWAVVQAFRKEASVYSGRERKLIWFWAGAALISLILATGRYAPFYRLFYMLPHASNIRNASKFMHTFHWSLVIVFAYGVHGLCKRYFYAVTTPQKSGKAPTQAPGWNAMSLFDRKFSFLLFGLVGLSLLGWLIYATNHDNLAKYISQVGFGDPSQASQIASFSIKEFGWFVLFLILTAGLLVATFTGRFSGSRVTVGSILLGSLLLMDLARGDLPWILYENVVTRHAANPALEFLADKPYEHRVIALPNNVLCDFYRSEWMQHQFPYYNIECLDDIQRPREAPDFRAFERGPIGTNPLRHWELTNTKYFLAPAVWLDSLNQQLDPQFRRFKMAMRFELTDQGGQIIAITNVNGQFAIFDFTGALPRAQLYSNWLVNTNDDAALQTLASTNFNPHATVILDEPVSLPPPSPTNQRAGSVEITSYVPKKVTLHANATAPCILLLNDKFDPNWHVTVDGKPERVLRANFIMRAVALTPGNHQIEFHFAPATGSLYVSLAAIILGLGLIGVLVVAKNGASASASK